MPVTALQALVLSYFADHGDVDASEAAAALGLDVADVDEIIADLVASGDLERSE